MSYERSEHPVAAAAVRQATVEDIAHFYVSREAWPADVSFAIGRLHGIRRSRAMPHKVLPAGGAVRMLLAMHRLRYGAVLVMTPGRSSDELRRTQAAGAAVVYSRHGLFLSGIDHLQPEVVYLALYDHVPSEWLEDMDIDLTVYPELHDNREAVEWQWRVPYIDPVLAIAQHPTFDGFMPDIGMPAYDLMRHATIEDVHDGETLSLAFMADWNTGSCYHIPSGGGVVRLQIAEDSFILEFGASSTVVLTVVSTPMAQQLDIHHHRHAEVHPMEALECPSVHPCRLPIDVVSQNDVRASLTRLCYTSNPPGVRVYRRKSLSSKAMLTEVFPKANLLDIAQRLPLQRHKLHVYGRQHASGHSSHYSHHEHASHRDELMTAPSRVCVNRCILDRVIIADLLGLSRARMLRGVRHKHALKIAVCWDPTDPVLASLSYLLWTTESLADDTATWTIGNDGEMDISGPHVQSVTFYLEHRGFALHPDPFAF